MADSGYPLPAYPPVVSTSDDRPTAQPVGYPPTSQNYTTQAPHQPGNGNYNYPSAPPLASPYHAPVSLSKSNISAPQHEYYQQQTQSTAPPVPNYPPPVPSTYPPQPNHAAGPPAAAVPAPTPQPNYNAIANPLPVVGPQYCLPHLVDLTVTRKLMTLTDDFVVTDVNQNTMFKVKGKFFSIHDKRVLLDSNGKPIVTLRHKILTAHSRWLVYRGDSSDSRDLLFTAKTSSVVQLKTKLNVYLANRTSEDSDFKVHGSWSERSCVVYVGESNTIAAQMHKKESAESFFLGKDTFMITIYPNVDYAFVVALIVILDAINVSDDF